MTAWNSRLGRPGRGSWEAVLLGAHVLGCLGHLVERALAGGELVELEPVGPARGQWIGHVVAGVAPIAGRPSDLLRNN